MNILKRMAAVVLIATAVFVGINWVATPLFDNSSGEYPVWKIIEAPLAACWVILLIANAYRKFMLSKSDTQQVITREYLEANLAFYITLLLALWFYWNYFSVLFPQNEPEIVGRIHLGWWPWINPPYALLAGHTGFRLWRDASRE